MADPERPFPTDAGADAVLLEFKGDAREAIFALLHDIARLIEGYEANVSHGFVRGGVQQLGLRRVEWRA